MDEKQNTGEFDLEDILKEFGEGELPQDQEDVLIWDGTLPQTPPMSQAFPQDTVRLDEITRAVHRQDIDLEQTVAFTPLGGELDAQDTLPVQQPLQEEPYSEEWEPEYEEPIGEYIPPEPIVYHPKSRLQELKKKLVAGPEKRYYQLSELGTGKLQALLVISSYVALGSMKRVCSPQMTALSMRSPWWAHTLM